MNRPIGVALVVVGIILIVLGSQASNSISSDFSRFFTGAATNKSIWLLIGGIGSVVIGGLMTLRGSTR